jgi:hypothetical protein
VYDLLHPLVFSPARPTEILMYADSTGLREARVTSLGATLVQWARRADALDDFAQKIEARKANPASEVPALVLLTQAAMAAGNMDQANTHLGELAETIETRAIPPLVQLACHAAIPAASQDALAENAFRVLKSAVRQENQNQDPNANRPDATSLGKLASMVNRYLAETGDAAAVTEFFESYLLNRQAHYARYGGDYGQYLQWRDWASIAEEAAKTGVTSVALDFMGRVSDISYDRYSRPSLTTAMAVVRRELATRTPAER